MVDFLKHINSSWTLFLDRDGVINKRRVDDYVKSPEEFEFLPGVLESMALFSKIFGRIIIVTNQQGVGKGWMTREQLEAVNHTMIAEIEEAGGRVDAVFYCTDLKDKPGNCRKPSIAMYKRALQMFPEINAEKSIMAGDSQSDVEFGENAGMFTVFIGTEKGRANVCFNNLKSFADEISK